MPTKLEVNPTYDFTAPAREVVEQINLRIPSEYGHVRQAAQTCFHALNDQGGNDPTHVNVTITDRSVAVKVEQTPYVHG